MLWKLSYEANVNVKFILQWLRNEMAGETGKSSIEENWKDPGLTLFNY